MLSYRKDNMVDIHTKTEVNEKEVLSIFNNVNVEVLEATRRLPKIDMDKIIFDNLI